MAQNPKYDNDMVNLGYLNKRLGQTEESISKNNNSISQLPKNYSTPPNPPYYKDSLLCYGNKIYKCNNTKLKGEFSWNDWTIVATDDTTISDFINNTYELDKLEIQEQIDGKVQTYYQENDPSKEWITDLDKGRHVGDYWYNTTNDTQWRYNQITTGSTITYGWGQVNIPKAVFDTIDSKKSIYTTKPTSYQKDDLWIIEETLSDEDLPVGTDENPIAKGDWVFSIANSEVYNKEHWVKRDEDISMTYIKQHYYTIGEINSSFEELERNTDSKITKAQDEISLSVSQTYTTKEEHKATIYDFDEKIGTINQTITEHKETIADISVEVGEITSTVESIQETTKDLEVNIDGVSADFEDFKDNEYIQSINNLQKQIDGAIQFWNGAEIPKPNSSDLITYNYPANEWTTENDKINHQADIYTVVQDVEGEMKQGKSYRFDKIDGEWQWIELTDNELSAVQAIAQEALDKAEANATEIGTIKTNVSELQQTDEQIKASVESIDKQIIPTANATGSNIYVEDASNAPLIQLEIEGKSTQATRSGINFFDYDNYTYDNTIMSSYRFIQIKGLSPNTTYSFYNYDIDGYIADASSYGAVFLTRYPNYNTGISGAGSVKVHHSSGTYSYVTFTTDDTGECYLGFYYSTKWTEEHWNNVINYFKNAMFTEGPEQYPYEQYGVQPSPDYPSKIVSVGYENFIEELLVGAWNLDKTMGYPTSTIYKSFSAQLKAGVYTLSCNTNINLIRAFTDYDNSSNIILSGTYINVKSYTFTITEDTTLYMSVRRYDNTDWLDTDLLQLEKGIKVHPYIPHGKYGIEVKKHKKNFLEYSLSSLQTLNANGTWDGNVYTYNGITYTVNDDLTVTVDGTASGASFLYISTDLVSLKKGEEYKLNGSPTGGGYYKHALRIYSGTSYISQTGNDYTFVYEEQTAVRINMYSGATADNLLFKPMIRLSSEEDSTYEKYQSDEILFVLNQPPRSLPNGVRDIAYIKNNMLCVDRYVGSTIFNGSETWGTHADTYYTIRKTLIENANLAAYTTNFLCNYFKAVGNATQIGMVYSGSSNLNFNYDAGSGGVDNFKTWLSENNMQLDYELAEPYTEVIGEIEMPSTFKGITYITTTDDLEPAINIEYVRDTVLSKYVEGQIDNLKTIEERHYAELSIQNDNIKASVSETQTSLDGAISNMDKLESTMTSQSATLEVISKNIDTTTGEVREVTTTTGFTFNAEGSSIKDSEGYEIKQTPKGAYYKDGDKITGQYTKDGSKQKDLELFGTYSYGKDNIDDTPMFVAQLYTDENGEECFGHFYNGGDY